MERHEFCDGKVTEEPDLMIGNDNGREEMAEGDNDMAEKMRKGHSGKVSIVQ